MAFPDLQSRYDPRDVQVVAEIPRAGLVVSTILSMLTMGVLAVCLSKFQE